MYTSMKIDSPLNVRQSHHVGNIIQLHNYGCLATLHISFVLERCFASGD